MNEEEELIVKIVENILEAVDMTYRSDYYYAMAKGVVSFFDSVGGMNELNQAMNE